jgi:fibronectin type 3 domain-containing protein
VDLTLRFQLRFNTLSGRYDFLPVAVVQPVELRRSSAPLNLVATGGPNSIILKWSPSLSNGEPPGFVGSSMEYYYVYRSTKSGNEQYHGDVSGNKLTYTDSSVTTGTVYFYEVTALNPVNQSGFLNEASA